MPDSLRSRPIRALHDSIRDDIADLITRRPLPTGNLTHLDPFLFLNHHGPQVYPPHNRGLPFGPHPHRGFETVTFVLEGDIAHHDSGGGESVIASGGIQWMTAGRGLVHSEVSSDSFKLKGGPLEILQLWVNLPARLKMTEPRYIGKTSLELTHFTADEGRVSIALTAGQFEGHGTHRGPVSTLVPMTLATVQLNGAAAVPAVFRFSVPVSETVFFYVVRGTVEVNGRTVNPFQLIEFSQAPTVAAEQTEITVRSSVTAVILVGHARPFEEPIVSHGPFVMNTREQIIEAIQDYQAGRLR